MKKPSSKQNEIKVKRKGNKSGAKVKQNEIKMKQKRNESGAKGE